MDRSQEAYRVCLADGTRGLVPENLVAEMMGLERRPGHGEVYRWLERYKGDVEAALENLKTGKGIRPPFDRIALAEDN